MTINEYLGIKYGSEIPHREKYGKLVQDIGGWRTLERWIPATKTEIKIALNDGDEHLNSIPLSKWDVNSIMAARVLRNMLGINVISLAECVCLLKEAAKQMAETDD